MPAAAPCMNIWLAHRALCGPAFRHASLACRWEFKAKHFDSLLCFKMVSLLISCLHAQQTAPAGPAYAQQGWVKPRLDSSGCSLAWRDTLA